MRRYGNTEPRVWTPPLRELTPETTLGYDVIDFARDVLCVTLRPWQEWLLIHALEIVGDFGADWHFRYRTVLVLVARQQGKTMLGTVIALFFMYVLGVGLILGTAQDLEQAEDTWNSVVEMAQENDELAAEIDHVWYTNGAKRLQLTGSRQYRVKASTRRAGRGKSADLVFLDELREHQTWDAWSALSKTGMARENCIVWCMSNAGDGTSVVLRHLRLRAHAAIGDPDGIAAAEGGYDVTVGDQAGELAVDDALGIFEWSAPPNSDPMDPDSWAHYSCPSLGYGVAERSIRSAVATDPEITTITETMCQWVTQAAKAPVPEGAWEAGVDERSEIAPDAPLSFGVDISADRKRAAIAVCGERADHRMHVELVAYERNIGWLVDWFQNRVNRYGGHMEVAVQGGNTPVASVAELLDAIDGVDVTVARGPKMAEWCGRMWDAVAALDPEAPDEDRDEATVPVMHVPQPRLDLAANIAVTRPSRNGTWTWDRDKSPDDISPIVAATVAYGLATTPRETEQVSAYAEADLLIL